MKKREDEFLQPFMKKGYSLQFYWIKTSVPSDYEYDFYFPEIIILGVFNASLGKG